MPPWGALRKFYILRPKMLNFRSGILNAKCVSMHNDFLKNGGCTPACERKFCKIW